VADYQASSVWSDAITLTAGDIVRNRGLNTILVCASEPPDPDDALALRRNEQFKCEAEVIVRIATTGSWASTLSVASGIPATTSKA
tara:strand:- start:620 stop:877 length:258 start_codon:yes stop_codon:yes gene_type:complete